MTLAPGESRTLTFHLDQHSLWFWNKDMKRVVEPGDFEIMAGGELHRPEDRRAERERLIGDKDRFAPKSSSPVPARNFVTLKIETDDGVTALGDATLNGRELAVASYLNDHVVPLLIGRDAHRIEDIWQYLYRGAYWRRGPSPCRPSRPSTWRCGISRRRSRACRFISFWAALAATA